MHRLKTIEPAGICGVLEKNTAARFSKLARCMPRSCTLAMLIQYVNVDNAVIGQSIKPSSTKILNQALCRIERPGIEPVGDNYSMVTTAVIA